MNEIWKDIDGFNGEYAVSNTGLVKSRKFHKERILRPNKDRYGYLIVRLCMNGKEYKRKIHRLVATAFIQNPQELPQINHKDGDKTNNNVENLEWCTAKDNLKHALDTGLRQCSYTNTPHYGEENGMSKITRAVAEEIRKICIPGDKQYGIRALARKYGLGATTVRAIVNNQTWK